MRIIYIFIFIGFCLHLSGQEDERYKNKVSVDGTYLLSFFKTEEARTTPFNINLPISKKYSFRTGFNINTATSSNKGFEGDFKIGVQVSKPYSMRWNYYYGTDFNSAYFKYNDRDNTTTIFSIIPFFGFEVFFTKEFSLSYEPKLIFNHYRYSDPSSLFDKESFDEEVKLTGLSQFYINFNF